VAILREGQVGQKTVEQMCREHGVSQPTYYLWKLEYAAMNEPDVKRLRELENDEVGVWTRPKPSGDGSDAVYSYVWHRFMRRDGDENLGTSRRRCLPE